MPRLTDLANGRVDVPKLDPFDIHIRKGFNYRDVESEATQKHIAWLKESIRENGIQKPVEVEYFDGKAWLVDGECRLLAARALAKERVAVLVPCIQVKGSEDEIRAKSMVANGALPPTQLEFGKAATQLKGWGWDEERIAKFTPPHIAGNPKKAKQYVKDALELHEAPLAVKDAVAHGIDGVAVSPALALSATRQNRMMSGEILKEEAAKARAKGKKVANRPKGMGKVQKAALTKAEKTAKLLEIGDKMAEAILHEFPPSVPEGQLGRKWQKAREQ